MSTLASAPPPPGTPCTLVFGGGSGIGRAFAQAHGATGTPTVVLGRTQPRLEDTAQGHANLHTHVLDLQDAEACRAAVAQIEATHGPVGAAVIASAVYPKGHFVDQPAADFGEAVITNILGVANAIRAVLPGMLDRYHGRVVVLGTLADQNPLPGSLAYSVSKGALHTLVKGLAGEVDRDRYPDILINEMGPGATKTAMSPSGRDPAEVAADIQAMIDMGPGSVSGGYFQYGHQIHLGETWKGTLKRKLGLGG